MEATALLKKVQSAFLFMAVIKVAPERGNRLSSDYLSKVEYYSSGTSLPGSTVESSASLIRDSVQSTTLSDLLKTTEKHHPEPLKLSFGKPSILSTRFHSEQNSPMIPPNFRVTAHNTKRYGNGSLFKGPHIKPTRANSRIIPSDDTSHSGSMGSVQSPSIVCSPTRSHHHDTGRAHLEPLKNQIKDARTEEFK